MAGCADLNGPILRRRVATAKHIGEGTGTAAERQQKGV